MPEKIAYTVPEFAALFGKERTWGYRQTYAGKVNTITMFGTIMVPVAEVERIMSEASRYGVSGNTVKRRAPKKKTAKRKAKKEASSAWKKYLSTKRQASSSLPISKSATAPRLRMIKGDQDRNLIIRRLTHSDLS